MILLCHTVFDDLGNAGKAAYIFEYTPQVLLKPDSVKKESYQVYNSVRQEAVPLRDVVYYPDTNTVTLYAASNEFYAYQYDLSATNLLQQSDGTSATLSQKCYLSYEYEVPYDTVSVLGMEYTKDDECIYNLCGKTDFSVLAKIVNNSKRSYESLPYTICINNDITKTIQSGHINIKKDGFTSVQFFVSDYIMQLDDEITILFDLNVP